MEKITVLELLKKYEKWVEKGEIQFLEKDSERQRIVLGLVKGLREVFQCATDKQKNGKGDISDNLNWYKAHQKGRKLWQALASGSLNSIEPESKGNSRLFGFLKAATEFEDILYGSEKFYRDHTLHSLWVYFIGEYILRDCLPHVYSNLNWYLINSITEDPGQYTGKAHLIRSAEKRETKLRKKVDERKNAIWCIMALCHDLAYSLEKLDSLNERVRKVLSFFDLPDFVHIGYSLDIEHQYIVSQFLESMAMDVVIVPDRNEKAVSVKCYRDDSVYWELCRALEKKQHGILSAYLIYKTVGIFAETWVRGPAEEWGLEDSEAVDNIIRGDILFAIAQHEFDFSYLYQLSSLADVLVLSDELEEFSRYGRELLSRQYHDTTAEVRIGFEPNNAKQGKDIEISIVYESKHRDPKEFYEFFGRKVKRLCETYSLSKNKKKEKYSEIKSINMAVERDGEELGFSLHRDRPNEILLPRTPGDGKKHKQDKYTATCDDDGLYIKTKDGKILLEKWIENSV